MARLAIGEPDDPRVIHLVGRTHWSTLAPSVVADLDDVETIIVDDEG